MNPKRKIKKKKILFKVEGSEKIGMGHVFRSFFLIRKLKKKYDIIIFTENRSKSEYFFKKKKFKIISYIKKHQFEVFRQNMFNLKIDKFVNDSIILNKKINNFLKELNCKCFFLDTKNIRATENFHCINTFVETPQKHKNYYSGLKYVIIDPSLKNIERIKINKGIVLLLHFGGTDDRMLNIKILDIIPEMTNLKKVKLIIGPALKYSSKIIYKKAKKFQSIVKIYNYPKRLNSIYSSSNLAVTTGGNTLFNLCSMNLKNISISANNMEKKNCTQMNKFKLTNYFGHYLDFNKKKFIHFYNKVILKKQMIKNKILFNGVNEIYKIICKP